MSKLIKNQGSLMLILPKDIVKKIGWKAGKEVFVSPAAYGEKKLLIEELPQN